MKRSALFPGTFDPITIGHVNIIERALPLFDEIVVGIGNNSSKSTLFSIEQRQQWYGFSKYLKEDFLKYYVGE